MTPQVCARVRLPAPYGLSWDQQAGRACVICGRQLTTGAVSRGWIYGRYGAHRLDVEVWCCPKPEES
ncbi:hypothetical protein ABT264_11215 [Streptomyces virginiae]|uniref:hypothetical protein n=1 Tax=Streptomyces virginiae TaxID=1961 RepID=UPI003320534F